MYTCSFTTMAEQIAEYHKRVRQWERQLAYEKRIVRSVPTKRIAVSTIDVSGSDVWEPG